MPKPLRLLIVEDSESDALLLARLLTKAGFNVTSQRVETRDSMQSALAQDTWDTIVADHNMPQFDAFAAVETLKSSGLDIPFIVASGSIGEETAVALMKAGAADYVMKDKLARLTAVVERELAEAASRRERRQAHRRPADQRGELSPALRSGVRRDLPHRARRRANPGGECRCHHTVWV